MKATVTTDTWDSRNKADRDEVPEITQADFERARHFINMKEVSREEWAEAAGAQLGKYRVNIMLDKPVVEYFKARAGDRGYQTLISETLRRVMESEKLEADLRRVIREELAALR